MNLFGSYTPPSGPVTLKKIGAKIDGMQIRRAPPKTDWVRPASLPDLSRAKVISIDTENWDPDINATGANSWRRGTGYVAGVSISTDYGYSGYFPIRHPDSDNFDEKQMFGPKGWLTAQLSRPGQIKQGSNIIYDLDALTYEGVSLEGPFHDIQIAEALLDENRGRYGLDSLGQQYLGVGKNEDLLIEYICRTFNCDKFKAKNYIAKCPASIVGAYATQDAVLTREVMEFQYPKLEVDGLLDLFDLECDLIPMLLAMRQRGVAVDLDAAEQLSRELKGQKRQYEEQIKVLAGAAVGIWESDSIARAFDKQNISYPRTKTGKPSFRADWLEAHPAPLAKMIVSARHCDKYESTFVRSYVLEGNYKGRIHCQFHQLKGDKNGTVSGRFSSSDPNLQNIPIRDEVWGPRIRAMFVPEAGKKWWSLDWSQIEYRLIAHFAAELNMRGGAAVAQSYADNPMIDYHQMVAEMTGLSRGYAKNLNFGLAYGMGLALLAHKLNMSVEEAEPILRTYHSRAPFVKELTRHFKQEADLNGYITTILGRRRRYDLWEPAGFDNKKKYQALPRGDAEKAYEGMKLQRAYTYAALNGEIQGSAADMMKYCMREMWNSGVFDEIGPPSLIVHDEFDGDMDESDNHVLDEIRSIMENSFTLRVPIRAEGGLGTNWSQAH